MLSHHIPPARLRSECLRDLSSEGLPPRPEEGGEVTEEREGDGEGGLQDGDFHINQNPLLLFVGWGNGRMGDGSPRLFLRIVLGSRGAG